jgi:hypothetical protein
LQKCNRLARGIPYKGNNSSDGESDVSLFTRLLPYKNMDRRECKGRPSTWLSFLKYGNDLLFGVVISLM